MIKFTSISFIILALILSSCQVKTPTPQVSANPATSAPVVDLPSPTYSVFTQIPTEPSTVIPKTQTLTQVPPTEVLSEGSYPILQEAEALALKFDTYLQQKASWIHIIRETISIPQAGQVFPPPYMISEEWFEVDTNGLVNRNVHTDFNVDGQIIQQAAVVGDYYVNFTTGDSGFNNTPRYRISMTALTDFLLRAKQDDNSHLTWDEKSCANGKYCLIIAGWENFSAPVQNPGETQSYYGAGERVWIDLATGQLIQWQSFWLLEDGSELASSTTNVILVEKVETPPQNIIDILGLVIVP
jgi:hypothetical protein